MTANYPGAGWWVRPHVVAWFHLWRFHFIPLSMSAGLVGMTAPPVGATAGTVAVGMLICTAGYGIGVVINDWFDQTADAVNAPDRPFVSGRINPKVALGTTLLLLGVILMVSVMIAPPLAAWTLAALGGHLLYTLTKGVPMVGNLVNGADLALFTLLGAAAVRPQAAWLEMPWSVWFQTALAVIVFSGFCLVGYFKDIDGDISAGYRTLPVAIGTRVASRITVIFPVLAVTGAIVGAVQGREYLGASPSGTFWALLLAATFCFAWSMVTLLSRPRENAYTALLWFTRGSTVFLLALGAVRFPVLFGAGAIPMMIYLEMTLRATRQSRQA